MKVATSFCIVFLVYFYLFVFKISYLVHTDGSGLWHFLHKKLWAWFKYSVVWSRVSHGLDLFGPLPDDLIEESKRIYLKTLWSSLGMVIIMGRVWWTEHAAKSGSRRQWERMVHWTCRKQQPELRFDVLPVLQGPEEGLESFLCFILFRPHKKLWWGLCHTAREVAHYPS